MKKLKVMCVFGTRPEAIKMAPLVKALRLESRIDTKVCVTAQHREQLDSVLQYFKIIPDFDLNIMERSQTLVTITTKALNLLDEVYHNEHPDVVLVHGDTLTTFVASLAAFYRQIMVGHVEAGLRTWNKYSPFPEEMDRQLTGVLADMHFAPTQSAARNLLEEGKLPSSIFVTGNTVIDAITHTVQKEFYHPVLNEIGPEKRIIFLTAHRRENLGNKLEQIFRAVRRVVDRYSDVEVVYPVHLNPKVRNSAFYILGNHNRIHLIDPLNVIDAHNFMARSCLILTDSGGIQEESPFLGIPCLVLRDTTERPEGLEAGALRLIGTDELKVELETATLITDHEEYKKMANACSPYGDGFASERIVKAILHHVYGDARPDEYVPQPSKRERFSLNV